MEDWFWPTLLWGSPGWLVALWLASHLEDEREKKRREVTTVIEHLRSRWP